MRGSLGVALLLVVLEAAPGIVAAHVEGSPPITQRGSFQLAPVGEGNAEFHASLESLGIPPDPGDTLRFSWSANAGVGPAIAFDIHVHREASMDPVYQASAIRVDDSWVVPGPGLYMVLWNNSNPQVVNVTYEFQLIAPVDLTGLLVIPVVAGVTLFLLIVYYRRPRMQE